MDARERWQALQSRLTAARTAVDAGDRAAALAEINAALELDAEFLAAHALRDRILAIDAAPSPDAPAPLPAPSQPDPSHREPSHSAASHARYATFEQRAKRRRVDRRIDAARAAIDQRRLDAAAAALDEVIDLDPNLPELAELTARFDELRRAAATTHYGPRLAAAAVFAAALLGGTWLQDSTSILSRQIVSAALLPALMPTGTMSASLVEVGTTGTSVPEVAPAPVESTPRVPDAHTVLLPEPPRLPAEAAAVPPPPAHVPEAAHAPMEAAALAPVSMPVPPSVDAPDDNALVTRVLQRYRTAYEGLDARSAQAVWPAVNQVALARAFDGLEAQSLTFDACDVRLRGEAATATCHGSARYVPKVGSRDPRVEPRVWNFTLRKTGADWMIDSARADRYRYDVQRRNRRTRR
jgi:hypothetical protein